MRSPGGRRRAWHRRTPASPGRRPGPTRAARPGRQPRQRDQYTSKRAGGRRQQSGGEERHPVVGRPVATGVGSPSGCDGIRKTSFETAYGAVASNGKPGSLSE